MFKDKNKQREWYREWYRRYYGEHPEFRRRVIERARRRMANPVVYEKHKVVRRNSARRVYAKRKIEGRCARCGYYLPEEDVFDGFVICCACRTKRRVYDMRKLGWYAAVKFRSVVRASRYIHDKDKQSRH